MRTDIVRFVSLVLMITAPLSCGGPGKAGPVSLVSIISNPEDYLGAEVTVVGYHSTGLEPPVLYLSEAHARVSDWPSGVLLYETVDGRRFSSLTGCHDQYVKVIGRFTKLPTGEPGISEITRVVALGSGAGDSRICFEGAGT